MEEDYKKAIDLLTQDDELDYKAVCIAFAKENPSAFVSTVLGLEMGEVEKQADMVRRKVKERFFSTGSNKVEAIKLYRELTGAGLKESKDAVEDMMPSWVPVPPHDPSSGVRASW